MSISTNGIKVRNLCVSDSYSGIYDRLTGIERDSPLQLLVADTKGSTGMLNIIPDRAAPLVDWLRTDAIRLADTCAIIETLMMKLHELDLDIYRISTGVTILHPHIRAESILCEQGKPAIRRLYSAGQQLDDMYDNSPTKIVYTEGRTVQLRISKIPAKNEYGIVPDLREEGATDYLAMPMPFSDGSIKCLTFATKAENGFSDADLEVLYTLGDPLGIAFDIHTNRRSAETLLDLYVGRYAGKRVLEGEIRRGHGETIDAVITFTDLRNFTKLSNELGDEAVIALLNEYFGIMTKKVDEQGGEVLKFIGDAVLAIFPYWCDQTACDATDRALKAMTDAHAEIERITVQNGPDVHEMRCGTALHIGDVFYGNVGGESRLDFTVIGPTVNLASRIESLTKIVGHPILVSSEFARRSLLSLDTVGSYELQGFEGYNTVYTPRLAPPVIN